MKIIDAVWEKRNLGVDCQEIIFDSSDSIDSYTFASRQLKAEYQVAKIPSGSTNLLLFLQSCGFQFIEMNLHLERRLNNLLPPKILSRFLNKITVDIPNSDELELILRVIKSGIFSSDKIALDPYFGLEQSGIRYYYWVKDELNNQSNCYILKYNNSPFGFNILKKIDDRKYNALFGALLPNANTVPGLGAVLPYYNCQKAFEFGGSLIETGVSSNNVQALRMNQMVGFEVKSITYNLIKHY